MLSLFLQPWKGKKAQSQHQADATLTLPRLKYSKLISDKSGKPNQSLIYSNDLKVVQISR